MSLRVLAVATTENSLEKLLNFSDYADENIIKEFFTETECSEGFKPNGLFSRINEKFNLYLEFCEDDELIPQEKLKKIQDYCQYLLESNKKIDTELIESSLFKKFHFIVNEALKYNKPIYLNL